MKKFLFIALLMCTTILYAEENPTVTARLERKYGTVRFIEENGLEYYETTDDSERKRKYGIVDVHGKEIIPCKYGFIDPVGILDENYEEHFSENYFWQLMTIDNKYGLADKKGRIIIPCIYDESPYPEGFYSTITGTDYSHGIYFKMSNNPLILISETGQIVIPSSKGYSNCFLMKNHADDVCLIRIQKGNKYGLLDTNGNELLPPIYTGGLFLGGIGGEITRYIDFKSEQGDGLYDYKNKCIAVSPKYYRAVGDNNIFELQEKQNDPIKIYYEGKHLVTAKKTSPFIKDINGNYTYTLFETENHQSGLINQITGNLLPFRFDTIMDVKEGNAYVMDRGVMHIYSLEDMEHGDLKSLASISKDEAARGVVSDADTNIPQSKKEEESTFAVIIANEMYETFVVPSANNDGAIFKKYCEQALGIPSSNIIYYEDATINNIHAAVNRIKDLAEVYDDGCKVIFYYAGQGVTDENSKVMYLLPSDGTLKAVSSTCYSVDKLYRELGALPNVEEALFIIDAPFNGMTRENQPMEKARGVAMKSKANSVVGKGIAIEAASEGETAYVYAQQNHGLLTYYILKAIQQTNGQTPIANLIPDVAKKVKENAIRDRKATQTVQIKKAN